MQMEREIAALEQGTLNREKPKARRPKTANQKGRTDRTGQDDPLGSKGRPESAKVVRDRGGGAAGDDVSKGRSGQESRKSNAKSLGSRSAPRSDRAAGGKSVETRDAGGLGGGRRKAGKGPAVAGGDGLYDVEKEEGGAGSDGARGDDDSEDTAPSMGARGDESGGDPMDEPVSSEPPSDFFVPAVDRRELLRPQLPLRRAGRGGVTSVADEEGRARKLRRIQHFLEHQDPEGSDSDTSDTSDGGQKHAGGDVGTLAAARIVRTDEEEWDSSAAEDKEQRESRQRRRLQLIRESGALKIPLQPAVRPVSEPISDLGAAGISAAALPASSSLAAGPGRASDPTANPATGPVTMTANANATADADRDRRTLFIGNVPAGPPERRLRSALLHLLRPFGGVESLRFRSFAVDCDARGPRLTKKEALAKTKFAKHKPNMNAYAVFDTEAAAREAAARLNGVNLSVSWNTSSVDTVSVPNGRGAPRPEDAPVTARGGASGSLAAATNKTGGAMAAGSSQLRGTRGGAAVRTEEVSRVLRCDLASGANFIARLSVFVGGLPFKGADEETLRGKLARFGSIDNVRIIRDKVTGPNP
jgi:hypothetical protein